MSDRLHIGHHQIYEWLYIYKEKGVSGLENKRICKKNQYSFEKKCEIIREYQESELTLPEMRLQESNHRQENNPRAL